jgi:hypothetical protein
MVDGINKIYSGKIRRKKRHTCGKIYKSLYFSNPPCLSPLDFIPAWREKGGTFGAVPKVEIGVIARSLRRSNLSLLAKK